jgi:hypothetical protein
VNRIEKKPGEAGAPIRRQNVIKSGASNSSMAAGTLPIDQRLKKDKRRGQLPVSGVRGSFIANE